MEILGIVVSLLGLMYFAYRGINVLVLAPVMALLACSFHADAPLLASYTQVFDARAGRLPSPVLPGLPARLHLRQAHERQRRRGRHRAVRGVQAWAPIRRGAGGHRGLRRAHLRRRLPVRRGVQRVSDRGGAVQGRADPEAAHTGLDRAGRRSPSPCRGSRARRPSRTPFRCPSSERRRSPLQDWA